MKHKRKPMPGKQAGQVKKRIASYDSPSRQSIKDRPGKKASRKRAMGMSF